MTATTSEDVQQQVLTAVRKSQEITLDAVKRTVETVNATTAKLPAVPLVGKLPQLRSPSALPGTRALPAPEKIVSATFDFLDRLIAEQRKFTSELVRATASLRPAAKAEPAAEGQAPVAQAEPAAEGQAPVAQAEPAAEGQAPVAE
jgi:hypothetical protein